MKRAPPAITVAVLVHGDVDDDAPHSSEAALGPRVACETYRSVDILLDALGDRAFRAVVIAGSSFVDGVDDIVERIAAADGSPPIILLTTDGIDADDPEQVETVIVVEQDRLATFLAGLAPTRADVHDEVDDEPSDSVQVDRRESSPADADRLEAFASIVNHDLRNPLNVAQGRLELARTSMDESHLDSMERAHTRMADLMEAAVAWARLGQPVTSLEPVEFEAVTQAVWTEVPSGDAAFEVVNDHPVHAEPDRFREILHRLFTNAVEHGGDGVTVRVGASENGFYVEDTGVGLPPDSREKAFEPGYSTVSGATGFGLSIVEAIVHAHGWTVTIGESDEGGARIEIVTASEAANA